MGLLGDGRVRALLAGFVLSLFALLGIAAVGLLAAVSVLAQPTPTTPFVVALVEAVAPYVVAAVVVGGVSFLLLAWLSVAAVRRASMPRDDRLARLARLVERYSSEARQVGLADHFEPTTDDRIEELKRRYVEGELTELEYERRLQELMDEEGVSDERVRHERSRTDFEFER
ncbi:SHOCT domain-containing protein [Halorussus caseinilyticus]|uniref:SHOCT domain-containing protein n=1 Tax=Halorussus caseinilyticus TaxID=3034025 RepID=A0ABD5WJZ9_9EURY|nr:SHOCT domain-containing protein [Halorussus sp. DT72]